MTTARVSRIGLVCLMILFFSASFADAGDFFQRIRRLVKKRTCEPVVVGCSKPTPIVEYHDACRPFVGNVICPIKLVGVVEDVDNEGVVTCRYQVYLATDCRSNTFLVDVPCNVSPAHCNGSQCSASVRFELTPTVSSLPEVTGEQYRYSATTLDSMSLDPDGNTRFRAIDGSVVSQYQVFDGTAYYKLYKIQVSEGSGPNFDLGVGIKVGQAPDSTEFPLINNFRIVDIAMSSRIKSLYQEDNARTSIYMFLVHTY